MNRFVTVLAATALVIGVSCPAFAQTNAVPTAKVRYGDIDLATANGKRILKLRVSRAAANVCDQVNERFATNVRVAQENCRTDTTRATTATIMAKSGTQVAAR